MQNQPEQHKEAADQFINTNSPLYNFFLVAANALVNLTCPAHTLVLSDCFQLYKENIALD